jgi:serine/threonine-protein kinase SRPK3
MATPVSNVPTKLELIENYRPGGYHPVEIGDELHNSRYRILHRLGHGAFSTVWLAQNHLTAPWLSFEIARIVVPSNNQNVAHGQITDRRTGKGPVGPTDP